MQIIRGRQNKPRRVLLYGQEGVGKSTWAANAPEPLFLDFEDGLGDLDVAKTPRLTSFEEMMKVLVWLYEDDRGFRTIVFDTVDWFEQLIHRHVCETANVVNIEKVDGGFGKGYTAATEQLQKFLGNLEALMKYRSLNVVMLGHCTRIKVTDPEQESYEKYSPDLHKGAAAVLREWCDEVFFASFRTFTRSEDQGFNKSRNIAIGGDERFIRTQHSAGVHAKNRLQLPPELPMAWAAYQNFWPKPQALTAPTPAMVVLPADGNISGMVVDGSSKKKEK